MVNNVKLDIDNTKILEILNNAPGLNLSKLMNIALDYIDYTELAARIKLEMELKQKAQTSKPWMNKRNYAKYWVWYNEVGREKAKIRARKRNRVKEVTK